MKDVKEILQLMIDAIEEEPVTPDLINSLLIDTATIKDYLKTELEEITAV